jgi:ferredoxin--NADP+ reductase
MTSAPDIAHVELPEVAVRIATAQNPAVAHVVGNVPCTHGKSNAWIRNIELDVSGTSLAGAFRAGQAIGVIPPGYDAQGRPHKVRLYSIASPDRGEDGRAGVLCTPVKRVVDEYWADASALVRQRGLFMGVCSNYLCDLEVGDTVHVTGPVGKRFLVPTHPGRHNHVFVATGTGIAPFRGMLLELLRGESRVDSEIWLLMGSPYTSDLLYHELFLELEREHGNFHYLQAISREPDDGAGRGVYVDALLERHCDHLAPLLADSRTVLYLCGLVGMQFNVFRRLATLGLLEGYAVAKRGSLGADPAAWTGQEMKHALRATDRCMIEVY